MRRRVVVAAAAAILLAAAALFREEVRTLLFGWFGFAVRTFPQARLNLPGMIGGLVFFAALAGALHYFAASLVVPRQHAESSSPRRWSWMWTLTSVSAVVLMFVVSFAAIGLARHIGWLCTSPEPRHGRQAETGGNSALHLQMIGLGLLNYHGTYGRLPRGGTVNKYGEGLHSWVTQILTYLPYSAEDVQMDKPWDAPENARFFRSLIPELINPDFRTVELFDREGFGLAHYAANGRVLNAKSAWSLADVTDGTQNTIAVGEVNQSFRPWGDPFNLRDPAGGINTSPGGFGGPPRGRGARFVMLDGSVRFLSEETDASVLQALSTPASGDEPPASPRSIK